MEFAKKVEVSIVTKTKWSLIVYCKIIVALDDSQLSQKAFEQSLLLAQKFDAELQLLNVISPAEAEYRNTVALAGSGYYAHRVDETAQQEWQLKVESKLEYLQSLAEQAMQAGVSAEFVQEIGEPERQICQSAREWEADLIVIGSHGRKGVNEMLRGSVSNYVSHHVPCDIMLVHQKV
ncbi:universal stress protein [Myxosarcina sp. GI1]|uniref:universal stress protein n=1 Tax=Myxosarcina sp. GI1 TaxID=1541065 RepID=UPI0009DCEF1A|nr:universal stress protein [Myxosarcina sp. GI1]